MEKENTKPKYSMHQNIIYILRNMWHWNKKLFFMSAARVPLLVILPFLGILMPKLVIDSLTNKSGPLHLTIVIGLVTLGMVLCSTLSEYLDGRITYDAISNREHYIILIDEKIMDTDYENLEDPEGQKMQEKASNANHNNSCGN
jgi:ATP-binding cassette subfamily B protein